MAIGKNIKKRLEQLGWEQKDLVARVPDLTPQALSNLIRRDSKRSEWDERIAAALMMSVLELVYDQPSAPYEHGQTSVLTANESPPRTEPMKQLFVIAENLREEAQWELLGMAKVLAAHQQHPNGHAKNAL